MEMNNNPKVIEAKEKISQNEANIEALEHEIDLILNEMLGIDNDIAKLKLQIETHPLTMRKKDLEAKYSRLASKPSGFMKLFLLLEVILMIGVVAAELAAGSIIREFIGVDLLYVQLATLAIPLFLPICAINASITASGILTEAESINVSDINLDPQIHELNERKSECSALMNHYYKEIDKERSEIANHKNVISEERVKAEAEKRRLRNPIPTPTPDTKTAPQVAPKPAPAKRTESHLKEVYTGAAWDLTSINTSDSQMMENLARDTFCFVPPNRENEDIVNSWFCKFVLNDMDSAMSNNVIRSAIIKGIETALDQCQSWKIKILSLAITTTCLNTMLAITGKTGALALIEALNRGKIRRAANSDEEAYFNNLSLGIMIAEQAIARSFTGVQNEMREEEIRAAKERAEARKSEEEKETKRNGFIAYVVNSEFEADLKVYITKSYDADKKVFFTNSVYEAEKKVMIVKRKDCHQLPFL